MDWRADWILVYVNLLQRFLLTKSLWSACRNLWTICRTFLTFVHMTIDSLLNSGWSNCDITQWFVEYHLKPWVWHYGLAILVVWISSDHIWMRGWRPSHIRCVFFRAINSHIVSVFKTADWAWELAQTHTNANITLQKSNPIIFWAFTSANHDGCAERSHIRLPL